MLLLPDNISKSKWFSPQQLTLLSSVDEVPVFDPLYNNETYRNIVQYYALTPDQMEDELFRYASSLLNEQKVYEAWQVILSTTVL